MCLCMFVLDTETERRDYMQAELHYQRAVELDPAHVRSLFNYANMLHSVKRDYVAARRLYERALEARRCCQMVGVARWLTLADVCRRTHRTLTR